MKKILFLPHCLRENQMKYLEAEGLSRGYEIYIVGGGSQVKKILGENFAGIGKIVGVACEDEIEKIGEFLGQNYFGVEVASVALMKSGCENTFVNLEKVAGVL